MAAKKTIKKNETNINSSAEIISVSHLLSVDSLIRINNSQNIVELNLLINNSLNPDFEILESEILRIDTENGNDIFMQDTKSEFTDLQSRIDYLVEEGIIEWAVQSGEPQLIMDLQSQLKGNTVNILLMPFIRNDAALGILIAFTKKKKEDFNDEVIKTLRLFSDFIAGKLYTITLELSNTKSELRLTELNERFMQSLPMTSFGEISLTVLKETSLPLQIIESNVNLIESGVGNLNRRLEIIKQQIKSISEIISLLDDISQDAEKSEPELIETVEIINEVYNIIESQLKSRGTSIEITNESKDLCIRVVKTQIEYAVIHLLMFLSSPINDNEKIYVTINLTNHRTVMIAIKDEGIGFEASNYDELIDIVKMKPSIQRMALGFQSIKNIMKNNKAKIECNSSIGNGTIFRLYFTLYDKSK